jgi:hypothetical protein
LVCKNPDCPRNGEPFTRPASWLAGREGRGNYCSNRCKGLATKHAQLREPFDADFARERFRRLEPEFEQTRAELGLPLSVCQLSEQTHTSASVIRTHAHEFGGTVIMIDGHRQLAFPPDAPERYLRLWAGKGSVSEEQWERHRARYLDPDFAERQQARTIRLLVEKRGLTLAQAKAVVRASAADRRRKFIRRRAGRRQDGSAGDAAARLFGLGYGAGEAAAELGYTPNYVSKLWSGLRVTPAIETARAERRLFALVGEPGTWRDFRDVHRALHLSATAANVLVDDLEARGLLERELDGRRVILRRLSQIVD